MARFELDKNKNVVVKNEGAIIIITAYSKNLKAIRCGFGYLPNYEMLKQIEFLFSNSKNILIWLNKSGKIENLDDTFSIENICFFYNGKRIVINKNDAKKEIQYKLLRTEQD